MSKFYCSLDKTNDDLRHIPVSLDEYCNSFDTQTHSHATKRWRLMRWAGWFRHVDTYGYSRAVCVTLFECSISHSTLECFVRCADVNVQEIANFSHWLSSQQEGSFNTWKQSTRDLWHCLQFFCRIIYSPMLISLSIVLLGQIEF